MVALPNNPTSPVVPLASGDRLTRREFARRYEAMPDARAELVEGVVSLSSRVRASHGQAHAHILLWLGVYCEATPGVLVYDNTTVRLDPDNELQPDALLRVEPSAGGRSRVAEDDYIYGAPELVVEVALSSASCSTLALHDKMNVYRRNEVQEYLVWQVYEQQLDWFQWQEGQYIPLVPDATGILCSRVFPGLWLDGAAMLAGNLTGMLAALRQGVGTAEHTALAGRLARVSGEK